MKTIDRYVLKEFLRIFFLSLIVMIAFYEMVTFIDNAGYFFKFKAPLDVIARFMLFKAPMALFHVTPICVMLASVLTVSGLSRNSEIVAMKACGMSMFRIAAPIIMAGAVISVLSFFNSEYVFHLAAKETNRIYYEEIKHQQRKAFFSADKFWYKADDGSILNLSAIDTKQKEIAVVSIFRFNEEGDKIRSRINAAEGRFIGGKWVLKLVVERTFHANGHFDERRWKEKAFPASILPLEDLNAVRISPEEMNLRQIRKYIADTRKKGYDVEKYVADMHAKIGFPLISFVMPFFALPMGIRSSRAGGYMVGIGVAVMIGVVFWFTFSMGLQIGRSGRLPAELGVYGPHALFLMIGLYMLFTDKQ